MYYFANIHEQVECLALKEPKFQMKARVIDVLFQWALATGMIPSCKLIYPTLVKGTSSSKVPGEGYVTSPEGKYV